MGATKSAAVLLGAVLVPAAAIAEEVEKACEPPVVAAPEWLVWAVLGLVATFVFVSLAWVRRALASSGWRLDDMLAEELVEMKDGKASTFADPKRGGAPQLVASSSRFVMLVGMLIMSAVFLGAGFFMVWALFVDPCRLTQFEGLGTYFLSGSALFAPYAVNKLVEVFKR